MSLTRLVSIFLCLAAVCGYVLWQFSDIQLIEGHIFGTYYKVKVRTTDDLSVLKKQITTRLQEIDREMSIFREDSEISAINRAPAGKEITLSPDMQAVMQTAYEVYRQSEGAFDPALGRLIDLWGFGASNNRSPSDLEITKAMSSSGLDKLRFADDFSALTKTNAQTYINLSAIAKGYAVDAVAEILDKTGCTDYIVEIGGELKAKGLRDDSTPWNIGITSPRADVSDNVMIVSLSNMAVATSGNYRNFYKQDGQILGHTISSHTGRPVKTDVASASVFANSCMLADAYATAIVALGIEAGLQFADRYELKVIIFDHNLQPHFSKAAAFLEGNN